MLGSLELLAGPGLVFATSVHEIVMTFFLGSGIGFMEMIVRCKISASATERHARHLVLKPQTRSLLLHLSVPVALPSLVSVRCIVIRQRYTSG